MPGGVVEEDGVRCMLMRGGTSKGLYFLAGDLPSDDDARDDLLLRIMGSPDVRQIDGLGGAHPLTSKVAVVDRSSVYGVDVDYHFFQVVVDEAVVTDRQNCGNLLAGVGPFAVERGLVEPPAAAEQATVRIRMVNTGGVATATIPLRDRRPRYDGWTAISGVPGRAAAIRLDFEDVAGSSCGALLPTGSPVEEVAGLDATLVDNGMPVVVLRAGDLGVSGYERCAELEANAALRETLERVRLAAGPLMNLGEVATMTVPKLTLVAPPRDGGSLCTRTFIPHRCHDAIGVLGAVSVATAALLPEGPAADVVVLDGRGTVVVEHPTGTFEAIIDVVYPEGRHGGPVVQRAGIVRTARKLMDGVVFPAGVMGTPERTIPPPHPAPHPPRAFMPPHGACDAHCHIFGPAARFPVLADPELHTRPTAGVDDFERLQHRLGLSRAVFVQASCHGTDNRAMVDALRRGGGRYAGVAMVDDSVTDHDLAELHAVGVRGTRFNFVAHLGGPPDLDRFWRIVDRIARLGWHVVLHFDAKDLPAYAELLDRMPCPYVIDHMARVDAVAGLDQPPFAALLELLDDERCWVKVSGAERLTADGSPPYDDVVPYARALIATAPDRVLWGTDWPHPNVRHIPDDGDLIDLLADFAPDAATRNRILVDNAQRLYDFAD